MSSIPVFPLPNTVVFPGMTIPLYVFEARYRKLVSLCLEQDHPRFIIALNQSNGSIHDDTLPFYKVGSLVHIAQVSQNPDGTYQIFIHGQERCQLDIVSTEDVAETDGNVRPLFLSSETLLPLMRENPNQERLVAWDTLETFQQYAQLFFPGEVSQGLETIIPEDLIYQASFICANIRIPADSRQILLEAPSLLKRFQLAQHMMKERIAVHQAEKVNAE